MLKYIYKPPKKTCERGSGLDYKKPGKGGWIWLHLSDPTEKELDKIKSDFGVPELILGRFFREQKSLRYTLNPLIFGLVDYYVKNGKIEIEKILFVIGDNHLITITEKHLAHYDDIYDMVFGKTQGIKNVGYLFYEIIDYDVEGNFDVLGAAENKVVELEKTVLTTNGNGVEQKVTRIIDFKRYLTHMWRRFWRSSKIIYSIRKGLTPIELDIGLTRLLDDVHDTYVYQMEMVAAQKEVLSDALTIYESVMSNRLAGISNTISTGLKKLTVIMFFWTAVATIIAIPNTFATIFGIPEWPITGDMWKLIAAVLVISTIVPIAWFYRYWQKFKSEHAA